MNTNKNSGGPSPPERSGNQQAGRTVQRDRQGRIRKGYSLNPKGRPTGSRNAFALEADRLLAESAPELVREAIRRAMQGDSVLLAKCLDKLIAPAKERPLDLSSIPGVRMPSQASAASLACLALLQSGDLTIAEMSALESIFKSIGESLAGVKQQQFAESIEQQEF